MKNNGNNLSISTFVKNITKITTPLFESIKETIKPLQEVYRSILVSFEPFTETISEANKNPDSVLSWMNYCKVLKNCFWVYPYKLETHELKNITKRTMSESDFDQYMKKHFKKKVVISLSEDTLKIMTRKHKVLYKQSVKAYFDKSYELCNIGLIAIIDDLTSFFISNKKITKRKGLFEPIINKTEELDTKDVKTSHFVLMMIGENIDNLYTNTDFNTSVVPGNTKKINRHSSMHGKYYSNKKEGSLMLMNTIYYLLQVVNEFKKFKNKLEYVNRTKSFKIIEPIPKI